MGHLRRVGRLRNRSPAGDRPGPAEPQGLRTQGRTTSSSACVEVARTAGHGRAVRDSKRHIGGLLRTVSRENWQEFLRQFVQATRRGARQVVAGHPFAAVCGTATASR
ncbi:DUF397 domain-containing protein [Streptomyces sp. SID486]|uniref:DUF397 domain-containing protein n=1 Tax=Streptomyces sp. SID486 TaxID=2690264 RepID=UPI001F241EE9|nr:DUF397 domain-containing protein [Streptomyces sp. SID486]